MNHEAKKAKDPRSRTDDLIFGLILVGVGTVVLLGRQGILEQNLMGTLWPLVIAAFGVGDLLAGRLGKGLWMVAIGLSLFSSLQGFVEFEDLWPVLLILTGASVLVGSFSKQYRSHSLEAHSLKQPEGS